MKSDDWAELYRLRFLVTLMREALERIARYQPAANETWAAAVLSDLARAVLERARNNDN